AAPAIDWRPPPLVVEPVHKAPAPVAPWVVAPSAAKTVDLLSLVDPRTDLAPAADRLWQFRDGQLESAAIKGNVFLFRYRPPAEYDYWVEFTREAGVNTVAQLLCKPDRPGPADGPGGEPASFAWMMGSLDNTRSGLHQVD